MTDTETSAGAAQGALIRMATAGHAPDVNLVMTALTALAAERDTLRQQLAEARNALVAIEDMGKDLKGAKMATLKIGLSFLCDTASEALKTTKGDET